MISIGRIVGTVCQVVTGWARLDKPPVRNLEQFFQPGTNRQRLGYQSDGSFGRNVRKEAKAIGKLITGLSRLSAGNK